MKEHIESVVQALTNSTDLSLNKSAWSYELARGAQHPAVRSGHVLKSLNVQLANKQSITINNGDKHSNKPSMPCRHCGLECGGDTYEKHLVEAHDDHHGTDYCMECEKGFTTIYQLLEHLRRDLDIRPFECEAADCEKRRIISRISTPTASETCSARSRAATPSLRTRSVCARISEYMRPAPTASATTQEDLLPSRPRRKVTLSDPNIWPCF